MTRGHLFRSTTVPAPVERVARHLRSRRERAARGAGTPGARHRPSGDAAAARAGGRNAPISSSTCSQGADEDLRVGGRSNRPAPEGAPGAPFAFKNSMIH